MTQSSAAPGSRAGLWIQLGASVALAVAFSYALAPHLQAVPGDLSIAGWVVVAYLLSLLPYHLLRAGRWQFLLAPLASKEEAVPTDVVTRVGLAGYMWIAVLPFRLGEFARPLFIAQRSKVSVSQALGTVAIERVVDGLAVCALFFVGVAGQRLDPAADPLMTAALGVMGVFALALVTLIVFAVRPRFGAAALETMVGWASPQLANKLGGVVNGVSDGLAALPSPGPLVRFCLATAAYWLANAAGMWILAQGCGLPLGFQQTIAVLAVMNIVLLVPGGPAQLGVFQTGVLLGLHMFLPQDVVDASGSKFTFYLYVCQLGTIAVLGLASQRSLRLDWRALFSFRPPR